MTSSAEMTFYVDSVRSLLSSDSLDSYTQSLLHLTTQWSQPFAEHFVGNVHPDIALLGSWNLQCYGFESATTNQAESFNFVIKKLQVNSKNTYFLCLSCSLQYNGRTIGAAGSEDVAPQARLRNSNGFEYHFACRRKRGSPLFYHESWQNDSCSFIAMTISPLGLVLNC